MGQRISKTKLTLAQLRSFVAVVDTGSMSEAGATLDVSQAAVSQAVTNLERAVGRRLVYRDQGEIKRTAAGDQLLARAREIIAWVEDIELELGNVELVAGLVRVASFRSAAAHILSPAAAAIRKQHPRIQLVIDDLGGDYQRIQDEVRAGRAHLGVLACEDSTDLVVAALGSDEYVLVVPKDGQPARGSGWPIIDGYLNRYEFLMPDQGSEHRRCSVAIHEYLKRVDRKVQLGRSARDESVILAMVNSNLGLSMLPRLAIEPLPKRVEAVRLPEPLTRRICLVAHERAMQDPAVMVVFEFLQDAESLRKLPAVQNGILALRPSP